jgi:hypothetical protein
LKKHFEAKIVFVLFLVHWMFSAGEALAQKGTVFGLDVLLGYDSLTMGHGNANSLRPGNPTGYTLSAGANTRYARFRNLFLYLDGSLGFSSWSSVRESGDSRVDTKLNAFGVALGTGVAAQFNQKLTAEVGLGGFYAPLASFHYLAEVEGYVPIESKGDAKLMYHIFFGAKCFYQIVPKTYLGLKLGSSSGGFGWKNPGTEEEQRDSYSSFGAALLFRYWLGPELRTPVDWTQKPKKKYQPNLRKPSLKPTAKPSLKPRPKIKK